MGRSRAKLAFIVALAVVAGATAVMVAKTWSSPPDQPAVGRTQYEWHHALQVVSNLRAERPSSPVVILLGGSSAREATVNEEAWTAQLREGSGLGGASAYDLATSEQTPREMDGLVRALPRIKAVVILGVGVGTYVRRGGRRIETSSLPQPSPEGPYLQHRYHSSLDAEARMRLLDEWVDRTPADYARWHAKSAQALGRLVRLCRKRKFGVVLAFLPANLAILNSDPLAARTLAQCEKESRQLARRLGVRYVDLNVEAHLVAGDFRDLWHVLGGARERCQRALSEVAAEAVVSGGD